MSAVAVVAADQPGKMLEDRVAAAVLVDREHRPIVETAAKSRRAIERAAGKHQAGLRLRAVAGGEALEHGIAGAVGVDLEHRPEAGAAAKPRRPIQRAAGQLQARNRTRAVAGGEILE